MICIYINYARKKKNICKGKKKKKRKYVSELFKMEICTYGEKGGF